VPLAAERIRTIRHHKRVAWARLPQQLEPSLKEIMMATVRYPVGCALGLVLGSLALPALAEPPASNNGLMTFPNVRVESAPAPVKAAKAPAKAAAPAAAHQAGMKAYMDPATGKLLESDPAATQHSSLNHLAPLFSRTPATVGTASTASTTTAPEIIYGPGNTQSVLMGEDAMVFQVVHRDADGKLTQECVTGESHAKHALHSPKTPRVQTHHQHEGNRNDR
jgi:hypothetical protein